MDYLLVDTCVWLDMAVDSRLASLLGVLDRLTGRNAVTLVVPDLVVVEFDRNSESVQQRTKKAYDALVKDAMAMDHVLAKDDDRRALRTALGNVATALPTFRGELNTRVRAIRAMLTAPKVRSQASNDSMMAAAFKRGLEKKAPFARGKNSCGDALLIEHFALTARGMASGERSVLVTSNKQDFSAFDDHRHPHPDIAGLFASSAHMYFINIGEYLKTIDTTVAPAAIEAAREAVERSDMACPRGGEHEFDPERGANLWSRYGGLTWHIFCRKCGAKFDTGDPYDD